MADEKTPIQILFGDDSLSDLSEDFKTKATVVFENAVAVGVSEEKAKLEDEAKEKLDKQKKDTEEDLEEKVDSYLTYVAEEWMKDNKLAVQNGIQTEIAENFLSGLKELFTESYVEVPESKVDIVAEITEELETQRSSLDESIDANIALKKENQELRKAGIVSTFSEGLADTQIDKLESLIEMVTFEDEEQFTERVKDIVSTYIKPMTESDDEDEDDESGDGEGGEKKEKKKKEKEDEVKEAKKYMGSIMEALSAK